MSQSEKEMSETIIDVVKAYSVGQQPDSVVFVIPKRARNHYGFKAGQRFCVKVDGQGRLIYELIKDRKNLKDVSKDG